LIELKEIWAVEQDILDHIDAFCREHGLRYSLAYGTLLGAVRHKGFIPWDDDVDIMMPREDYEKLLQLWDVPGYILQNKYTNDDFSQNFTKIRKDNTAFIQDESEKHVSYHTGIFVDIFPADRVAPEGWRRKLQFVACAVNLLYAREHTSGTKTEFVEKILLLIPRSIRLRLYRWSEKFIGRWNGNCEKMYFIHATIYEAKWRYSSDVFDNFVQLEFAGKMYSCIAGYEKALKEVYGNYMELPPEEDRVLKHYPLYVSIICNYLRD